jgi:RNA polymerase sigma-70 factor (ECF subfamily)
VGSDGSETPAAASTGSPAPQAPPELLPPELEPEEPLLADPELPPLEDPELLPDPELAPLEAPELPPDVPEEPEDMPLLDPAPDDAPPLLLLEPDDALLLLPEEPPPDDPELLELDDALLLPEELPPEDPELVLVASPTAPLLLPPPTSPESPPPHPAAASQASMTSAGTHSRSGLMAGTCRDDPDRSMRRARRLDGDFCQPAPLGSDRNGFDAHNGSVIRLADVLSIPWVHARSARSTLDRARLRTAFEQNYAGVWRFLRRMGVPTDRADDASQQVFLIALTALDRIVVGCERGFLYGTAARVAAGYRRQAVREVPTTELDVHASPLPAPDDLTDQKRAREVLDAIIDCMELDLRTVFVLAELDGFTAPEIAQALGIPLGTATSRLRRARETFRSLVQKTYGDCNE